MYGESNYANILLPGHSLTEMNLLEEGRRMCFSDCESSITLSGWCATGRQAEQTSKQNNYFLWAGKVWDRNRHIEGLRALRRKEQSYIKSKPASECDFSMDVAIFGLIYVFQDANMSSPKETNRLGNPWPQPCDKEHAQAQKLAWEISDLVQNHLEERAEQELILNLAGGWTQMWG